MQTTHRFGDPCVTWIDVVDPEVAELEGFRWQTLVEYEGLGVEVGHARDHLMGPKPDEQAATATPRDVRVG